MKELVSIVIPIYNTKKELLEKCLMSIKDQTYTNIEVLLVDDGSEEWCKKTYRKFLDEKVKVINQENSGVSAARNNGIQNANGKYIMFVDADDWIENDCCEKLINAIEINKVDIVVTKPCRDIDNISVDEKSFNYLQCSKLLNEVEKEDLKKSILIDTKNGASFYLADATWAKLFKLEFINKNKLSFKTDLKMAEDGLFNFEAYCLADRIYYLNENLYHYVMNNESVCNNYNTFIIDNYTKVFIYYEELFNRLKINKNMPEYSYFIYRQIPKQMKQYFCNKDNNKKYQIRKSEFKEMIKNEPYYSVIRKKNYNLNLKSNIIYLLIKYKFFFLLNLWFRR